MERKSVRNYFAIALIALFYCFACKQSPNSFRVSSPEHGDKIDELNAVPVYYNKSTFNSSGRHKIDGYNLGMKWQCVEFVKRYYFKHYKHKMPNTWGHAKDFFKKDLLDGALNKERSLKQYKNPSKSKPLIGDLIVMDGWLGNEFGHVAIVSKVEGDEVELIQQNCGTNTRVVYDCTLNSGVWYIDSSQILGWLRKE